MNPPGFFVVFGEVFFFWAVGLELFGVNHTSLKKHIVVCLFGDSSQPTQNDNSNIVCECKVHKFNKTITTVHVFQSILRVLLVQFVCVCVGKKIHGTCARNSAFGAVASASWMDECRFCVFFLVVRDVHVYRIFVGMYSMLSLDCTWMFIFTHHNMNMTLTHVHSHRDRT